MSDPIQSAMFVWAAAIQDDTDHRLTETTTAMIAAYERSKVVCDECGGKNKVRIQDGSGVVSNYRIEPCPNPGPTLMGPDGPFHADAERIDWRCEVYGTLTHVQPKSCPDDAHTDEKCGWVNRYWQTVWEEDDA